MKINSIKKDIQNIIDKRKKLLSITKEEELQLIEKIIITKKNYYKIIQDIAYKIILPKIQNGKIEFNFDNFEFEFTELTEENCILKQTEMYKRNLALAVYQYKNFSSKNRPSDKEVKKFIPIEVSIKDKKNNELSFLSILGEKLNKKCHSRYSLKSNLTYYDISDFNIVLARLYLADIIFKFQKNNPQLSKLVAINYIIESGKIKEKDICLFNEICNIFNYKLPKPTVDNNITYDLEENIAKYPFAKLNDIFKEIKKDSEIDLNVNRLNPNTTILSKGYLEQIYDELKILKMEEEKIQETDHLYAKSYETKRNIPKNILEAMKSNIFLNYFSEVEYDELTDLKKIDLIKKDFLDFFNTFEIPNSKEHTLRFRRLGKYRAGGLYFPSFKTICIDLDNIKSFVHECMHMIDYTYLDNSVNLSNMFNFKGIIYSYKKYVERAVRNLSEEDPFRKKFYGKSKYNKDYYFYNTEIFARCGEIYVKKILKKDYSIVGECNSILYPDSDILLEQIKDLFDSILIKKERNIEKCFVSSNSIKTKEKNNIIKEIDEGEQLSLF